MKRFFAAALFIFVFGTFSLAQKNDYRERKLAKATFEKNEILASTYYQDHLTEGDSSFLNDYASSLFRQHQFNRSYDLFKISHKKNQLTKPAYISEFIQLLHYFDSTTVDSISFLYQKILLDSGYKIISKDKSNFRFASVSIECYNSNSDDFGVCQVGYKTIFASTRNNVDPNIENSIVRIYTINDTNACIADEYKKENDWLGFFGKYDAKFHLGPISISRDKSKIFVTANYKKQNNKGERNLTILESHIVNKRSSHDNVFVTGNYSELMPISFANANYSYQHPFYDNRSGYLYFSSNKPGGAGGFDIYKVKFEDTAWGTPENITYANTAASEAFPSVDGFGNLYYSSKTVNGFGGLDILKIRYGKTTPTLLDSPINSAYDDFGLFVTDNKHGYFCSNRIAAKGGDNIYNFAIHIPPYKISLEVKDSATKVKLKNCKVEVKLQQVIYKLPDKYEDTSIVATSNDTGGFVMMFSGDLTGTNWNASFTISKDSFEKNVSTSSIVFDDDRNFSIEKFIKKTELVKPAPVVEIKKIEPKIKVGVDLGKLLQLNPIYFDVDKFDIRPDAAIELDKIVNALKELPKLIIELGSHTDSRGTKKGNQTLSQRRAESSGKYIISKGIDANRLSWKGYGDTKPLNKCKRGVKCSEKEYAVNRRTEFRIVKM